MSDPTRLLASNDATDLERELLSSWADERPSAASRDKTLAMLGVATTATAAGVATASIAPKAAAAGWIAIAKWLAVSTVVVGAAIGVGVAVHSRTADVPPPIVTSAPTQVIAEKAAPVETAQPLPTATTTIELPDTTRHTTQAKTAPVASTLSQQVAALDRARAALDASDFARARHLVDAYESEFPGGDFTQEAEVIRIDALVREGNREGAERAGKHFLGAYPKSPHTSHVRRLLGYDP